VAGHLLTGALICVFISLRMAMGRRPTWVPAVVCWWHGRLCRVLGLRVQVSGTVANHCLLVANHISWLDIPVLGAQGELGFLSKAEVRGWPLVGWMSAVAGTLFIERGANQAATVSDQLASAIASGRTLVIFPEGTTSDGREVRRFHPRLFAAARQPGLRVQPVALAYRRGADLAPDLTVPFVGEETLAANLWRVLRHPGLVAEVRFLCPLEPEEGEDRKGFAARARQAILGSLGLGRASLTGDASPPSAHASVADLDCLDTRANCGGKAAPAMERHWGLAGLPGLDRFIERQS
jgi:1-acyl-sn-glycerol-3-phosphate acyltransferase